MCLLNAALCTFAPVLMVMMAVERVGPAITSQAGMVGPVSTILMGAVLLDEPLTLPMMIGTSLVIGGVMLVARPR